MIVEPHMTDKEAVQALQEGRRARTEFSLHEEETPTFGCDHRYRVIACDSSDIDVIECSKCGRQRLAACNFDDEYA